jgi:hypothetical protein
MKSLAALIPALLLVSLLSSPGRTQGFRDDFDGTSLNSGLWNSEAGSGVIQVEGGFATLTCSGPTFPVVMSRPGLIPSGPIRVRVGLQYLTQSFCGDGFGAIDNFWENYHGAQVCRPFLLWQDGYGLYVYTSSINSTVHLGSDLGYHVYEWIYQDGAYQFSIDDIPQSGGSCAPPTTGIFFGHPHPIGCFGAWTSFRVDFVEVRPFGATVARRESWGRVQQIYR